MRVMGLDEAGRGPVLGGLYMGGVVCSEEQIDFLKKEGVNDSKALTPSKRRKLFSIIIDNCIDWKVIEIPVSTIDKNLLGKKKNLNELERDVMRDLIILLNPDKVFIDAIGTNLNKFVTTMIHLVAEKTKNKIPDIIAKNKADSLYTIVGAASILAKVKRDESIENYKKEFEKYGDIGSGYTSDPRTINFLKKYITEHKKPPVIARKSWKTTQNLMNEILQTNSLKDFI